MPCVKKGQPITKPKKCKVCTREFKPQRSTQIVCGLSCAIKIAKEKEEKQKAKAVREDRSRRRKEKQANKTLAELKRDLQKIINEIVRLIDKDLPCIARPGEATLRFDAGHYHGIGAYPALRYHLDNIHKQSSNSNQFKGGDEIAYKEGLIDRYGIDYMDKVSRLPVKYKRLDARSEDVKEWIKEARKIRTEIKKGAQMTRKDINDRLGIYTSV